MLIEPREALARSSTYTLPTDQPGWIDLTTVYEGESDRFREPALLEVVQGVKGPLHTAAIFAIEGDRLTYCVAAPDQPRPTEFVTRKGDGYTLVSLKRHATNSRIWSGVK
jgi:uncharacterized protein (TIGR03067 family)